MKMMIRKLAVVACVALGATGSVSVARADVTPAARASAGAATRAACPAVRARHVRCLVELENWPGLNRRTTAAQAAASPAGLGPKAIEAAYRLPVSRGSAQTVAVVEAYHTTNLAGDLSTYRTRYHLPACTTSAGCLQQVNQAGNASPPPPSSAGTGWDLEATLDVDMVSASCPRCKILVVEADSDSVTDIAAAEDTAARLGAQVISNSYGARESGDTQSLARHYRHPGHVIVASSGDYGFTAANFPANLATVTTVGGTTLTKADNKRGWREAVWNNGGAAGSGCSAYVAKPAWQHDSRCEMRTVADVSAVASNIAVYEPDYGGWLTAGGTSAAAPLIAGVYALAGNATTITPGYEYKHRGSLFDVITGNNNVLSTNGGAVCKNTYLCVAKKGYDAPTGLGTPDGTRAF